MRSASDGPLVSQYGTDTLWLTVLLCISVTMTFFHTVSLTVTVFCTGRRSMHVTTFCTGTRSVTVTTFCTGTRSVMQRFSVTVSVTILLTVTWQVTVSGTHSHRCAVYV